MTCPCKIKTRGS